MLLAVGALLGAFAFPPVGLADLAGGCDFAPVGTTASCLGPLPGSTFAGGDGNLLTSPTTFGTTDWQNAPSPLAAGVDLASGSSDNSFGQGTKEDDPNVTVVTGSIPPNKSDLIRFYEAAEFASGSNFLYLAWERTNILGNANMDFEISQNATTGFSGSTTGAILLNRTPGDLLVTYDFANGGGRPILGLNRWLVSGTNPSVPGFSPNVCFASNSFPCWGDHLVLNAGESEGAVNNLDAVTDPINPNAPRSLPTLTFGETAINLTTAGVFLPTVCNALGSIFLKSRASSSFTSEVKDFVAPVPIQITNCGEVTIIKHTDPAGLNQSFSYTSNVTGTVKNSNPAAACQASYNLNDASANTMDCVNVPAGTTYAVTEGTEPTGFVLESLTCTATGGSSGAQDGANPFKANIIVTAGGSVTCTYVNKQQLGAIKITKVSSKAAATPLSGAEFSITGPNSYSNTLTTGPDGTACVDNLLFGDYVVTETKSPGGYQIDNTSGVTKTVNANAKCSDASGQLTYNFTDTPLTDLTITVTSEAVGGTKSTITCVLQGTTTNIGNSPQPPTGNAPSATVTANGLIPGTYVCTVVVDP